MLAAAISPRPRSARSTGVGILLGRVLFGVAALGLFAASVFWNELGKPWEPSTSALLAYGFFALHLLLVGRRLSPLDPLVWIPVGFLLFYFGMPVVIDWLGVPTAHGYDPWQGNSATIARGFCVALLAFVSFLLGGYLAGVRGLAHAPPRGPLDRSLGAPALLFTLGSLAMVAVGIAIVGPSTVFGLYHEWWDAKTFLGADQRFLEMGIVFAQAGVFALLASDEPDARWRRWFAYLVFVVLAVMTIQKGDRTGLIALGVGAGWCYSQRIGRLRWTPILAVSFVVLLVLPVIREWRAERRIDESKRSSVLELASEAVYSMGGSVSAIVYTVDFVPAQKHYEWGSTFWNAAINAVPNVGLTKGKDWAAVPLEESPSAWITAMLTPAWYASGGAYGFAMAAEWYFNFGMPGVWLGMALVGFLTSRIRNASPASSLALVWSATFFAAVAMWIRNVLGYPLRVAVWPVVGLIVIRWLLSLLAGRRRRNAPGSVVPA